MKPSNCTLRHLSDLTFKRMRELGYSENTIKIYLRHYRNLVSYATPAGEDAVFSEQLMLSYMNAYRHNHPEDSDNGKRRCREAYRFLNMMLDCSVHGVILRHKVRYKKPPEVYQEDISRFAVFARDRGLSSGSVDRMLFVVDQLAYFSSQKGIQSFSMLGEKDILGFAKTQLGYAKKTAAAAMYALRVFIFFLNSSGINTSINKEMVPSVRYVSRRSLPKIWSEEECRRILKSVERNTPVGKRDYAILMAAINLGMRTSDIIALKFSDIDWGSGQIHFVQQKTGALNTLTLDNDTGWAIIDYLKNGRPDINQYPNIFLKHTAPVIPLNECNSVLQKYLRRADVHCAPGQMHGMHSLRHSLATRMLQHEVPVGTIADILGHMSINSSVDYLEIDIEGMRKCALEVEL